MGESVIKSLSSFLKKDNTATLPKEDIQALTKEDISALLILLRNQGIENVPAKKPVSDSEIKARLQWLDSQFELARLLEKNEEKVRAVKTLKIAAYGSVKAKAESSLKEPVKDVSSEDDSEDEKESDEDEKPTKEDTKATKRESTSSDDS